jgi:hypothetical protein
MVAVETDPDVFSIFEIGTEARPDYDDRIEWDNGTSSGDVTVRNVTRDESYSVIMQDHGIRTKAGVRVMLGLKPLPGTRSKAGPPATRPHAGAQPPAESSSR